MDYTPELSAFQGVLVSADNVESFSKLTARGGNEIKIAFIISSVHKFLEQQTLIDQNGIVHDKTERMRKYALYIILNSDLTALEQLVESDGIASVIWTLPTIPKCLMCEILWRLHLDKFIYEVIAFCTPQLALQVSDALVDYFKYCSPSDSLSKLNIVTSALYQLLCRMDFFDFKNDVQTEILQNIYVNFQKCVNFYVEPPNSYKLNSLKKDAQYRYKGECFEKMILLVDNCLCLYTSVQQFAPENFIELYQLTYKVGEYRQEELKLSPCHSPNRAVSESLEKCNEILLDKFQALVMDISVDIFCSWSEFEENGKSMQQKIGELCHKLRSKLQSVEIETISEHPVVDMIQQISRKPANVIDIVNVSDGNTIVENMNKNEDSYEEWVHALVHKDKVLDDLTLVKILDSNIKVLNEEECFYLFNISKAYVKDDLENSEQVKTLAVKAFEKCTTDAKNGILDEHFQGHNFNDTLEISTFDEMLMQVFNKVIAEENANFSGILVMFLQNPQKVFTKMFHLSCESQHQAQIMLQAITLLRRFNSNFYPKDIEPCIIRITEDILDEMPESAKEQDNLIKFLCGLKNSNIIPGVKLLLLVVLSKLHKALLNKNQNLIHFLVKLLSEAYLLSELLPYRLPMLIILGQIADAVRWNITTFVSSAPMALELTLGILTNLIATYDEGIPDNETQWLKSKLRGIHPLNCYYYRPLWNPPGDNFVEIVSGTRIKANMNTYKLTAWLSKVLSSSTKTEWCYIWDSMEMLADQRLSLVHDALLLITAAEQTHRNAENKNTWDCVLYCVRNFVHIARYKFLKEPIANEDLRILIRKISKLASLIKTEDSEPFVSVIMPLFAYIVTRKNDYTVNVAEIIKEDQKNEDFSKMCLKVFN